MSKLPAPGGAVADFLTKVAETPTPVHAPGQIRGRLIFALDATASREPAWDHAARIQGEMFAATAALGGLELQLAFFRGFGEFKVSRWVADSAALLRLMGQVRCAAGETQIAKVLRHAANETRSHRVNALVLVGDAVEEDLDQLGHLAGELGVLGLPVFAFHEGSDPVAAYAFQEIARLSRGAYCPFDASSAHQLRDLLGAVATFAVGGRKALADYARRKGGEVRLLAKSMEGL
ncbi:MAG: VWA domain-containing protein [Magnetospirillum sp. WYHS-4]